MKLGFKFEDVSTPYMLEWGFDRTWGCFGEIRIVKKSKRWWKPNKDVYRGSASFEMTAKKSMIEAIEKYKEITGINILEDGEMGK